MTRIHFDADQFADLVDWAESVRDEVEGIGGLLFADLVRTGDGHGMMIAAYRDEAAYVVAADRVAAILAAMGEYLSDPPHTHAGTVVLGFGR